MSHSFSAAVWNVMHDHDDDGPEFPHGHRLCQWCSEPLGVNLSDPPVESDGLWHHAGCWKQAHRG